MILHLFSLNLLYMLYLFTSIPSTCWLIILWDFITNSQKYKQKQTYNQTASLFPEVILFALKIPENVVSLMVQYETKHSKKKRKSKLCVGSGYKLTVELQRTGPLIYISSFFPHDFLGVWSHRYLLPTFMIILLFR